MQRHLVGEICTQVWINWKCLPCIFRSNHVENGKQLSWIKHTTKFNRQHLHLIVVLWSKIVGGKTKCRYKGKSILGIGRWHNWVILATVVSVPLASAWHQNLFVFHYFLFYFYISTHQQYYQQNIHQHHEMANCYPRRQKYNLFYMKSWLTIMKLKSEIQKRYENWKEKDK